jgi:hypothetical protein
MREVILDVLYEEELHNVIRYLIKHQFSTMPQYFNIIEAHGILAAITLLFIVPFAVLFPRFYTGDTRLAVRSISGTRY